jgi:hypothetical protein
LYGDRFARFRKIKTIDCTTRTIGFKVFDIPGDGIISSEYLVDSLNRVIFSGTGMEAFVLA